MRYVQFGEIHTSALGFGCGSVMGRVGRRDSLRAMAAAWDAGIRLFDTARSYGYGEAEALLGEFLIGKRAEATVVTKFGILPSKPAAWKRLAKPVVRAGLALLPSARGLVRRQIAAEMSAGHFDVPTLRASLHASLRALRTDYVDVLLLHLPPADVFRNDELMLELAAIVQEGKARRVGISTDNWALLWKALEMDYLKGAIQTPWPALELEGTTWRVGDARPFAMVNHVFGGADKAQNAVREIEKMAKDDSISKELRAKLRGDARERVAQIVFGSAFEATGAQAIVASMLHLQNLRANVAAMDTSRFTVTELRAVVARIVAGLG